MIEIPIQLDPTVRVERVDVAMPEPTPSQALCERVLGFVRRGYDAAIDAAVGEIGGPSWEADDLYREKVETVREVRRAFAALEGGAACKP